MDAIKFLKFDFRLIKGYGKFYLVLPLLVVMFIFMNSPAFALNYLFFFVLILSSTPFSLESSEQCQKLYYSLPSKIENMVRGRYLFLISVILSVLVIESFGIVYFKSAAKITDLEILGLYLSAAVGSILCMIQYPIYYKFGYEKGKLTSMLIYLVPAFFVFSLPSIISDMSGNMMINEVLKALNGSIYIQIATVFVSALVVGSISYKISCGICRNKEI
jgi:hypothetical protein